MKQAPRLTKADTVALWHAVEAFALQTRLSLDRGLTLDQLRVEHDRVRAARQALRKVNALRRLHAGNERDEGMSS
ncbi:MAG: hypothetical protein Q8N06_02920 [Hydrogenophaga sp.]|nr:hypothetical protein [Hydrogenophaga sp.]